jgi:hypothetical protein
MLHALLTFALAARHSGEIILAPWRVSALPSSVLLGRDAAYPLIGGISVGYMALDLLQMACFGQDGAAAMIHHAVVLGANLFCQGYAFAQRIMVVAYSEELSTIVLNLPALLNLRKDGTAYAITKGLFVACFVACRCSVMWAILLDTPRMWRDLNLAVARGDVPAATTLPPFVALTVLLAAMRAINTYWLLLIARRVCRPRSLRPSRGEASRHTKTR